TSCAKFGDGYPKIKNPRLVYPDKFIADRKVDRNTSVYHWPLNAQVTKINNTDAGTFTAFTDTITQYSSLSTAGFPFTALEFLNETEVRLTNDNGNPPFDTTVVYDREDYQEKSKITIHWSKDSFEH